MRTGTVSYKLEDLKKGVIIPIGFVGENDFTRVIFDAEEIYKKFPNASVSMKVQPPKGVIYPATVTRDGNTVIWQVKEADVANRGGGELQLTFTDGETKIKTYIVRTDVKRSLAGNGPDPDPVQDFVDNANEKLAEVDDALADLAAMDNIAKNAQESDIGKSLSPKTVVDGVVTEWQYTEHSGGTDDYTDLDNKPQIAGVTLSGNKTLEDLGIAADDDLDDVAEDVSRALTAIQGVENAINHSYSSVSNMLADTKLIAGMMVKTQGFTSSGDGGGGTYLIVDSATTNAYDTFATSNGKYAVLQHNGHVNAKQCGLTDGSYGGDAWFAFYNGTALSMDINVNPLYISNTVQLNNTTEIYSSNKSILYYVGMYDAAVLSCFSGNGLSASAYQSTKKPKLHNLTINARNAKVGVCLVNIANSYRTIYDIYVYKGYVGFLFGQNWRNTFGTLEGSEQTYATFCQEEFKYATLSDFTAISTNGSLNSNVFEYLLSTKSPNGALLDGYGSDNTFVMIDIGLDLADTEQTHYACKFKIYSGTVNTIYCEHDEAGASFTDLYVDNAVEVGTEYDYNKGLMINEVRGRRFYLNNNVVIGTLYLEDWEDVQHEIPIDFSGGVQANRVSILHLPQGKWNGYMPYGVCGVAQELAKLKPEYELIETVEFASAAALSKNTKPNGDAYNFDGIYIEIILPSNTTFPSCNITFYDETNNQLASPYYGSVAADTNNSKYAFIKVWNENGFVWEEHGLFTTNGGSQTLIKAANTVHKLNAKIAKVLSTQQMQPGTIVKIYGY